MAKRAKAVEAMIKETNEVLWNNNVTDANKFDNPFYVVMDYLLLKSDSYKGYNCFSINANGVKVHDKNGIVQFV